MRRTLLWSVGLLLLAALVGGVTLRLFCGPVPFIGGGWLRGEVETEPVSDWSFIPKQQHNLEVESRANLLPFSTEPWFMVHEGELYLLLPSLFGDSLQKRIQRDPALRVRVEGRVYPVRAERVEEEHNLGSLLAPFLRRQMAVEIGGSVRRVDSGLDASVDVYRLVSRPADTGSK